MVDEVRAIGEQISAESDHMDPDILSVTDRAAQHLADDKRHGGVGFLNNRASQKPHVPPTTPNGPEQQLAVDKRLGGVGFFNNLLSRFRSRPPSVT